MNKQILKLRKALIYYEECVDVDAAEHITAGALMVLQQRLLELQVEVNGQLVKLLED